MVPLLLRSPVFTGGFLFSFSWQPNGYYFDLLGFCLIFLIFILDVMDLKDELRCGIFCLFPLKIVSQQFFLFDCYEPVYFFVVLPSQVCFPVSFPSVTKRLDWCLLFEAVLCVFIFLYF